jgi:PAS domain S-box-containing protein
VAVVFRDISERKRTEKTLRESEFLLQGSLDAMPDHVAILDRNGVILKVNEAWRNFASHNDYPGSDYGLGSNYVEACVPPGLHPSECDEHGLAAAQGIQEVIEGKRDIFALEYPCHSPNEFRWFLMRVTAFGEGENLRVVVTHQNVTARHLAEQNMQASEEKFRTLFTSMDEGFALLEVLFDENGKPHDYRFHEANPAFEKQSGLVNVKGKTVLELLPGLEPQWVEVYGTVAKTGEPKQFEADVKALGRVLDVYAFRSEAERTNLVGVIFRDITEDKKAEQRLVESEAKYRTLFDSIDEGFAILELVQNEDGRTVDFIYRETNLVFKRQTGFDDVIGKRVSEVFSLEPFWFDFYGRVSKTGVGDRAENYAEGLDRWYSVYASRIGGEGSRLVAAVFDDITERKRRELGDALLADIAEGLSALSPEAMMQSVGEKLGEFLGISQCMFARIDESQDKATVTYLWDTATHSELAREYQLSAYVNEDFLAAARSRGTLVIHDTQTDPRTNAENYAALGIGAFLSVPFHNGDTWTYLVTVNVSEPRTWREDEVDLVCRVAEHLFPRLERARAEAALQEVNVQLAIVNEKQKQFVADAAHELRAPLTAIQGNLQLLNRYKVEEPLKEEMLGDVRRESERLGRLVNDLLAIARGDNGLTLTKAELALEQVLLASWRNATVLSSQHRFELGDLPRVGIVGNADRLQQLTLILLENAVKYTPQGGSISLGLEQHKGRIRFYVRDTGIGISGEDLPRVFERFFRADKARTRSHDSAGTGLGLSIAEWIVGQHGGKIWLESELQQGTTVWVELPLP